MSLSIKIVEKLKGIKKPVLAIYPVIIIITIPSLLIINTIWNLKSFNRDANFIVRHQALSIAEVLTPIIKEKISSPNDLKRLLNEADASNEDVISAALLKEEDGDFSIYVSTREDDSQEGEMAALNQLAKGFNQPIAGLTYDPNLQKDVWNVIVPVVNEENGNFDSIGLVTNFTHGISVMRQSGVASDPSPITTTEAAARPSAMLV